MLKFLSRAVLMAWVAGAVSTQGLTLYSTEFEEFNVGPDQWVGTNGWVGTGTGLGVHGIDLDILPGLGQTAFLGFNRPDSTFVTVVRPLDFDPVAGGMPTVEFETLMGIEDSTNGFRDSFFYSFYSRSGALLASLRFDNSDFNYGIWRLDGVEQTDTDVTFIHSQLHLLFATIDYEANTWSADLDGVPLFTDAAFNASGAPLDLGFVAVEWQLGSSSTNQFGDNWLLTADLAVRAYPDDQSPFAFDQVKADPAGGIALGWTGSPGFDYLVEYSDGQGIWKGDLPGSTFTHILVETSLQFTDGSAVDGRTYRLQRTFAP